MKKSLLIVIAFCVLFSFTQCKKDDKVQPIVYKKQLQSKWEENGVQPESQSFGGHIREFLVFKCDSFYTKFHKGHDAGAGLPPCNQTFWDEYAKGVYALNGDTIHFAGVFTDSTWEPKYAGCYTNGVYDRKMDIEMSRSALTLIPLSNPTYADSARSIETPWDTMRFNKVHSVECNNWPEGN